MSLPFDYQRFATELNELDRRYEGLAARQTWAERGWPLKLRRDLEAEAVAHSTRIEGVPVTVDQVRQILAGESPAEVAPGDRELVEGYRDGAVLAQRRGSDPSFTWHTAEIVALQANAMRGTDVAGRLRTGPVYIVRGGEPVFTPPPGEEVPTLLGRVCERAGALTDSGLHPALIAAWIHVAIAAVHPFADGNGRTARLCATLAMCRGGRPAPFASSLEEWWGRHTSTYYDAFACLGRHFTPEAEVTPFVEAHLSAQLSQARALELRDTTQRRLWRVCAALAEDAGLPARAGDAIWEAFYGRPISARRYRELADVSPATARNDLSALSAAGYLRPSGRTRGRLYLPGPAAVDAVAKRVGVEGEGMGISEGYASAPDHLRQQAITALASDAGRW